MSSTEPAVLVWDWPVCDASGPARRAAPGGFVDQRLVAALLARLRQELAGLRCFAPLPLGCLRVDVACRLELATAAKLAGLVSGIPTTIARGAPGQATEGTWTAHPASCSAGCLLHYRLGPDGRWWCPAQALPTGARAAGPGEDGAGAPEGRGSRGNPEVTAWLAATSAFTRSLGIAPERTVLTYLPTHEASIVLLIGLVQDRCRVCVADDPHRVAQVLAAGDTAGCLVTTSRRLATLDAGDPEQLGHLGLRELVVLGSPPRWRGSRPAREQPVAVRSYQVVNGRASLATAGPGGVGGFWSWARDTPDRIAVIGPGGERVSATDLWDSVRSLAAWLTASWAPGSAIVSLIHSPIASLTFYLACCWAGLSVLVLDPTAPVSTWPIGPATVAYRCAVSDRPETVAGRLPGELPLVGYPDCHGWFAPEGESPGVAGGLIAHSTGTTTGRSTLVVPRPARGNPEWAGSQERLVGELLGFAPGGTHLVASPHLAGAPLSFASLALHAGETLAFLPAWSPSRAVELIGREQVTSTFMFPSMLAGIYALGAPSWARLGSLRTVIHGSAPAPAPAKRRWIQAWGPILIECYGASGMLGTYVRSRDWLRRPGTVGRPLLTGQLRICRADGQQAPPYEVGSILLSRAEISLAGPVAGCAPGLEFVPVGDRGYLDAEGWLYLAGRETDYLKVGGRTFHPGVIESVLRELPQVHDCAVVGVEDPIMGQRVVALIVPRGRAGSEPRQLIAHCRRSLPTEMVPTRIVDVARLPYSAQGELCRRELRQQLAELAARTAGG